MSLLLLIPAIILPVVLLAGFAACDRVFGLYHIDPPVLMIESATGKDAVTITLVWQGDDTMQKYQFHRTNPDGTTTDFDVPVPAAPFDDTGLNPNSSYTYQVREFDQSGDPTDLSAPVTGTTLPLTSAYAKTLTEDTLNWQGYTLVQRIEAAHLAATGPHVRLTVQAASASDVSIDRVYISQADSSGKRYDSAADLTAIYDRAATGQPSCLLQVPTLYRFHRCLRDQPGSATSDRDRLQPLARLGNKSRLAAAPTSGSLGLLPGHAGRRRSCHPNAVAELPAGNERRIALHEHRSRIAPWPIP